MSGLRSSVVGVILMSCAVRVSIIIYARKNNCRLPKAEPGRRATDILAETIRSECLNVFFIVWKTHYSSMHALIRRKST